MRDLKKLLNELDRVLTMIGRLCEGAELDLGTECAYEESLCRRMEFFAALSDDAALGSTLETLAARRRLVGNAWRGPRN